MNERPPDQDSGDDVDDAYRRASAADPSRPSESVRRAVLEHAATLAAERAAKKERTVESGSPNIDFKQPAANQSSWRAAIFGTLAAAALAGLLITPHYFTPQGPSVASLPPAPVARQSATQEGETQAPASESFAAQEPAMGAPAAGARASTSSRAAAPVPAAPPAVSADISDSSRDSMSADRRASAPPAQAENMDKPQLAARNAAPAAPAADSAVNAAKSERAGAQGMAGPTASALSAPPRQSAELAEVTPPAQAPRTAASTARNEPAAPAASFTDPAVQLRRAAEMGDVAELQSLLDRQLAIDARDAHGRTPLMLATLHGRTEAVRALLAHGADPNAADARGTTPLQAALAGNQSAIAAALRLAGAR